MRKLFACTVNATIARTTNTTNAVIETTSSVDFALALLSRLSAMPGRYTRARTGLPPDRSSIGTPRKTAHLAQCREEGGSTSKSRGDAPLRRLRVETDVQRPWHGLECTLRGSDASGIETVSECDQTAHVVPAHGFWTGEVMHASPSCVGQFKERTREVGHVDGAANIVGEEVPVPPAQPSVQAVHARTRRYC